MGCKELFGLGFGLREAGLEGVRVLNSSAFVETEARALEEASFVQDRKDKGLVCFLRGAMRELELLTVNVRVEITDEALVGEAFKYESSPFNFVGVRYFFSSTPSLGFVLALVVGESSGLGGLAAVKYVGFQAPLSVILAIGSPWVMETEGEKSLVEIRVRGEVDKHVFDEAL